MSSAPPPFPTPEPNPYTTPASFPGQEPWQPQAIAIMTTVGGGLALLWFLVSIFLGFMVCYTFLTCIYSLVVGIICLIKGITMLNQKNVQHQAPYVTAILQIVNIINCDVINLALGIIILVLLSDPQTRTRFQP